MTSSPLTPGAAPIRLMVVDDHTLFRRGLVALLAADERFEVVGEAGDAAQAQHLVATCRPQVLLLDNHLPGVSGVVALPALLAAAPGLRVLMLTMSEDEHDLAAALKGGACGYLLKTVDSDELGASIVRAAAGQSSISATMTAKVASAFRLAGEAPSPAAHSATATGTAGAPGGPASSGALAGPGTAAADDGEAARAQQSLQSLSTRERETLELIARGDSNKEIARALGIAEATVKIHVQHILRKLGLASRVQAAAWLSGLRASAASPRR
ncbi:MAG: response regulator [Burkholderiales bacterium]|nr:response regulator [Burkholderiales bacterium]